MTNPKAVIDGIAHHVHQRAEKETQEAQTTWDCQHGIHPRPPHLTINTPPYLMYKCAFYFVNVLLSLLYCNEF